jgi:uncharacterized membrane protein
MTVAPSSGTGKDAQKRRWLLPLLIGSLSLNLLVAGVVLGGAWMRHGHMGMAGRGAGAFDGPITRFVGSLPRDRRTALRDVIASHRKLAASFSGGIRQSRLEISQTLTENPFNRAHFEAALGHLNDAELASRKGTADSAAALVEQLNQAERTALLHELHWPKAGGPDGRDADQPPDPDSQAP